MYTKCILCQNLPKMKMEKNIRLDGSIYSKIEYLKGKKSYGEYVGMMLKYFEVTGINPESLQAPLAQETKNGIERIVKIIKAIEKEKINKIITLLESPRESTYDNSVDGVSESQLLEVMNINEEMHKNLEHEKKQKETLLDQNRMLRQELEKRHLHVDSKIDIEGLLDSIETIEGLGPTSSFSSTISIRKQALTDLAMRMRKCLGDVHQN